MNQYDDQYQPEEMIDQETIQEELPSNNELQQCQQDVELWKNQASRIFADFENYKKRMDKEQVLWMAEQARKKLPDD